jgi:hypothetical protein
VPFLVFPSLLAAQIALPPISTFSLSHTRPSKEIKSFYFSMSPLSCNFGVYNIGEKGKDPDRFLKDRIGKLQDALVARYGNKLLQHAVSVERFRLIFNGSSENKATAVDQAFGGGVIAPILASPVTKKPKCDQTKMDAGWFDPAELTNDNTPIIFEIVLNVDGNKISTRRAISAPRNMFSGYAIELPTAEEVKLLNATASMVSAEVAKAAEPFIG